MLALEAAIKSRENIERNSYGFRNDSSLLASWKEAYKSLSKNEGLEVVWTKDSLDDSTLENA
jgi:hypothetical protein